MADITTKLDADQQHNADALEAIGVEYPIQKRYIITESQLRAINAALFDASSFYDLFDDDNDGRGELIRKGESATENLDPAPECEHWNRTCKICGVWPVLEGWLAGEEYYCNPCGEACTTEEYTTDAGIKHTGLSVPEACKLTWKDDPDNDYFYWTQWELCDGDCSENEPCECHCWLCTKYQASTDGEEV